MERPCLNCQRKVGLDLYFFSYTVFLGFFQKLLGGSKPKIVEKLHKALKAISDSPSSRENFNLFYTLFEEYDGQNGRGSNAYFEKEVQSLIDYTFSLLETNREYFIPEYPFFGWLVLKLKR